MPCFEVDRYEVRTEIQRLQTAAGVESYTGRSLTIFSTPIAVGGILRAVLQFSSLFDPWHGRAVVGRLVASDPLFPVLSAWLPLTEFGTFYDILRNERPLALACAMRDAGATTGFIRHLSLGAPAPRERQEVPADFFGLFGTL
ncbi:MAG: hypothetical protein JNM48_13775 [Rhodospirillales bacterium]|nr:hypothetical protein [Rhodospirillales bacterium]